MAYGRCLPQFIAVLLLCFFAPAPVLVASAQFPLYPVIEANVRFWEDIYSRYTTQQAVLHDKDALDRMYAVIDLAPKENTEAEQINKARMQAVEQEMRALFAALASGAQASTREQQRIAALFPSQRPQAYESAKENMRWQIGQKDRFEQGVIRSGKYLPHIKEVMAAAGLPLELAYLPHVESSFNPRAGSKAAAYGLWQFTRSTGKQYMTINSLVDERFDPYISSRAAAQMLKDNYAALGSWPLALTAYNYGRAGMVRAVQSHGNYERIFRWYDQGYFKFASRNFYSEFLAAFNVARRLERSLAAQLDEPENFHMVRLRQPAPMSRVLAEYRLSRSEFIRLNPSLLPPVLSGQEPLPANFLLRIPAAGVVSRPSQQQVPAPEAPASTSAYLRYTVKAGDTLASIAQRFGVTIDEMLILNGKGDRNPVRVGDSLRLPVTPENRN